MPDHPPLRAGAVHFCWIGARLPWPYAFSIASAAASAEVAEVILHHTDALDDEAAVAFVRGLPGVQLRRLEATSYLARAGLELGLGDTLVRAYRRLDRPVVRCDLLRLAVLYREGGIYLDLDTVTRRSLAPLLSAGAFVGTERIVWPGAVRRSRNPLVWARALALDGLRKLARWHPEGWRHFRRLAPLYSCALNNAVMGGPAHAPVFAACLRAIAAMPPARLNEPFALGPDLLETVVPALPQGERPRLEPPDVFYPLAPEISDHWFRDRRSVDLDALLPPANRVVHWYASVRTRARVAGIDPEHVRRHRRTEFYSALISATVPLDGLAATAAGEP